MFVGGAVIIVLLMAGPFLVVETNPYPAEAIVVIGGDHKPDRVKKAVELYQAGYAPLVIISAGTSVLEGGQWMTEAEVMKQQALNLGLPNDVIVLEAQSWTTYENAQFTKSVCKENEVSSILLVTSAYHSRRAHSIFQAEMRPDISISTHPADLDYCALCWPLHPDQAYVVGYEYYNWLNYWAKYFGVR